MFDAKVRAAELVEGDRVLVKNVSVRGKHKLADRWERPVHVVVKRIDGGPVYVVKPERGGGPHRTLHRDLLLPCGFLPVEETPGQGPQFSKAKKMGLRGSKVRNQQAECDDSEGHLTDEEAVGCVFEGPPQITSWGPFVQEIECTPKRRPLTSLNPNAPDFHSQHSIISKQLSPDQSTKPVDPPFAQSTDYVVIDIPECDTPEEKGSGNNLPVHEESETFPPDQQHDLVPQGPEEDTNAIQGHQSPEPRRSNRERRVPHKFTYDELGKPLILALSSFFESLQDIITPVSNSPIKSPVEFSVHAGTHAVRGGGCNQG